MSGASGASGWSPHLHLRTEDVHRVDRVDSSAGVEVEDVEDVEDLGV